jgi:hypothetical protein
MGNYYIPLVSKYNLMIPNVNVNQQNNNNDPRQAVPQVHNDLGNENANNNNNNDNNLNNNNHQNNNQVDNVQLQIPPFPKQYKGFTTKPKVVYLINDNTTYSIEELDYIAMQLPYNINYSCAIDGQIAHKLASIFLANKVVTRKNPKIVTKLRNPQSAFFRATKILFSNMCQKMRQYDFALLFNDQLVSHNNINVPVRVIPFNGKDFEYSELTTEHFQLKRIPIISGQVQKNRKTYQIKLKNDRLEYNVDKVVLNVQKNYGEGLERKNRSNQQGLRNMVHTQDTHAHLSLNKQPRLRAVNRNNNIDVNQQNNINNIDNDINTNSQNNNINNDEGEENEVEEGNNIQNEEFQVDF